MARFFSYKNLDDPMSVTVRTIDFAQVCHASFTHGADGAAIAVFHFVGGSELREEADGDICIAKDQPKRGDAKVVVAMQEAFERYVSSCTLQSRIGSR